MDAWAGIPGSLGETNDSDISKSLVRHWLLDCKTNHTQCGGNRAPNIRKWRPSRLISFTLSPGPGTDVVQLVDGAPLPDQAEYVALSHCWGKVRLIRLLASTEAKLRAGYPISQLPKTFREAIQVCRWLDYRYIWVDSLCIIQDSAEDWQTESQTMKLVYGRGAITIAAAHAPDSTKGLFTERDPNSIIPPIVPCNWQGPWSRVKQPCCVIDMEIHTDNIEDSNLASRGWTVQERVLSPRLLSFGKTQMFYQCLKDEFCESFPLAIPGFMIPIHTSQLHGMRAEPREAWYRIVKAYSAAKLTKDSDKLIAIAGVAEAMQERLGDRYVAGLWEGSLLTELLWGAREADRPRPNPCIAPTWSWLSTNSTVDIVHVQVQPGDIRKQFATVVSTGVDLLNPSYATGNIHPGAVIQLRGRLKPAEWDQVARYGAEDYRRYQITCDGFREFRPSLNWRLGLSDPGGTFIHVDALPGPDVTLLDIYILPIAVLCRGNDNSGVIRGLVLTPKDISAGIYERVASFWANDALAAYLFLKKVTGDIDQATLQVPSGTYGRVEGYAFSGTERWTKIPERDIIIV